MVLQQHGIHSEEFSKGKKSEISTSKHLEPCQQSMIMPHIVIKRVNPMKSTRVYSLLCDYFNIHDKVLMLYSEVC